MKHIQTFPAAAAKSPPLPASPAASAPEAPSTATKAENWTKQQWNAARKKWAVDKARWAGRRRQSNIDKLSVRQSWAFLK